MPSNNLRRSLSVAIVIVIVWSTLFPFKLLKDNEGIISTRQKGPVNLPAYYNDLKSFTEKKEGTSISGNMLKSIRSSSLMPDSSKNKVSLFKSNDNSQLDDKSGPLSINQTLQPKSLTSFPSRLSEKRRLWYQNSHSITQDENEKLSMRQQSEFLVTLEDIRREKGVNTKIFEASYDWLGQATMVWNQNTIYVESKTPPTPSSNFTIVSCMFDLGRGELNNDFRRDFSHYIDRFKSLMRYEQPKVIFIEPKYRKQFEPLIKSSPGPVYIIEKTVEEIRREFPFWEALQRIRTDPNWSDQEGWLSNSPQATLELYNPTVMSKIVWTRDVARLNPFQTELFLWIDGGHLCNNPDRITNQRMDVFRRYMDKMLITFFDYTPSNEVHGFKKKPFYQYLGMDRETVAKSMGLVRVGRGGIFGSSLPFLEVVTEIFHIFLRETLSKGFMGTEENIFSMLLYHFPQLVHDYENGEGGNCAIFSEAVTNMPPMSPARRTEEFITKNGYDLRGVRCQIVVDEVTGHEIARGCFFSPERHTEIPCPAWVTPTILTAADNQHSCHMTEFFCTVVCRPEDNEISWLAHACYDPDYCRPYSLVSFDSLEGYIKVTPKDALVDVSLFPAHSPPQESPLSPKSDNRLFMDPQLSSAPISDQETRDFLQRLITGLDKKMRSDLTTYGWDLRGLQCELFKNPDTLELLERCFIQSLGPVYVRDFCPSYVTSAYLASGADQYACLPESSSQFYCTVVCQDGTEKISWTAFEIKWCNENPENCPPKPPVIPMDSFSLTPWSLVLPQPKACQVASIKTTQIPISAGILARCGEHESLALTLRSYAERGFLQAIQDFKIYLNKRCPQIEAVVEPYTVAPFNLKVLPSDTNDRGILNPLNYLIGNASNHVFLFLEKDFRLVESIDCTIEQLNAGIEMLVSRRAHVIKFRSRYNAGRPNWAEIMFRDDEERVFQQQPNLLCNLYHWIQRPDLRWPDQFSVCNRDPEFFCSDSFYCNWTNNPVMFLRSWWQKEYLDKFPHLLKDSTDDFGLESFMNWHPGAWNDRGWVVAQGDGMFKHSDVNNFGSR